MAKIVDRVMQYVALRDKIKSLDEEHKTMMQPYRETLEKLNNVLLEHLQKMGVENAKTEAGTVYITKRQSASVADGEAFWNFVIKHKEYDLIERRANSTAVAAYIEANKEAPPGVNFTVTNLVGVRRPT